MNARSNNSLQNLLAFDFGLQRIGVATGSCLTGAANPLETITAIGGEPDWARIDHVIKEWAPDLIVLGLPYNKDGNDSEMTSVVRSFATRLESLYPLPVEFVDERYTSVEAKTLLREQRRRGVRNKKLNKEDVDAVAAQLIAESWMNTARHN
jgi:putative Holliday junction resolvase